MDKWSREFYFRDEEDFAHTLAKRELDESDIDKLLSWKSTRYAKAVRTKLKQGAGRLNELRKANDVTEQKIDDFIRGFYPEYPSQAPVFGTFIKHVIDPDRFPILDEYAHAAYHRLVKDDNGDDCSVYVMSCYKEYSKWFNETRRNLGITGKKLDEALWAYGKESSE